MTAFEAVGRGSIPRRGNSSGSWVVNSGLAERRRYSVLSTHHPLSPNHFFLSLGCGGGTRLCEGRGPGSTPGRDTDLETNAMTPKIRIRPYEPADVDGVCEAVRESMTELTPWMSWCHPNYSRQDAIAWVEGRPKAWESKEEYSFVIVDSSERILGSCGLHRLDIRNGAAELGYWVRSSATRQGVATAAVRELCAWAFSTTDLHRLEILTAVTNAASQRVAEKSGAVREAVLRQRLLLHGQRHDGVLLSILRDGSRR